MGSSCETKEWLSDFDALVMRLDDATVAEAQELCALGRSKLDALEARRLAKAADPDDDLRRASRMAQRGGKRSKQELAKQAVEFFNKHLK